MIKVEANVGVKQTGLKTVQVCAAAFLLSMVFAQVPPGVGVVVDFPQVGALSISHSTVSFDLSGANYPPATFPGYYYPVAPDQPMSISVTSNQSNWVLTGEFTGLLNVEENVILPPHQLQYSIDGSEWYSFASSGVTLAVAPATTSVNAPQSYTLELRLMVTGNEVPGRYEGTLTFSLVSQ